jgi:hypothetical protein
VFLRGCAKLSGEADHLRTWRSRRYVRSWRSCNEPSLRCVRAGATAPKG